jgi:hypothetical protein
MSRNKYRNTEAYVIAKQRRGTISKFKYMEAEQVQTSKSVLKSVFGFSPLNPTSLFIHWLILAHLPSN